MNMNKIVLLSLVSLFLVGCSNATQPSSSNISSSGSKVISSSESSISSTTSSKKEDEPLLVSKIVHGKHKNYLEVDGYPFIYNGCQIRTDWLIAEQGEDIEDMEFYFEKAANLGVNCVEIPLRWKDIEPKKDAYDFRSVSAYMRYAKKYNLRIEFLLFGVNIGGMTSTAPDYIKKDPERYPRYDDNTRHPDALFFVQNHPNTIGREVACARALMDAIYLWSVSNQYNAVIAIQVRNEPDLYFDNMVKFEVRKSNGELLSYAEAYEENLQAIKTIGQAIKECLYQVITRVNICCYFSHSDQNIKLWNDILATGVIDVVGEDTYRSNINPNKEVISNMLLTSVAKYNTVPQIAENTGHFENGGSLFLMSNMLGAGYNLYDMITPSVITDSWGYNDWGILNNKTKQEKPAFAKVKKILKGINLAGPLFPITSSDDIACFNLETDFPCSSLTQEINTSKTAFSFTTNDEATAFAINNNNYIYLYSDNPCSISISYTDVDPSSLQTGHLNLDGTFVSESSESMTNNKISLSGMKLYRIQANNFGSLTSNTINKIHSEEK